MALYRREVLGERFLDREIVLGLVVEVLLIEVETAPVLFDDLRPSANPHSVGSLLYENPDGEVVLMDYLLDVGVVVVAYEPKSYDTPGALKAGSLATAIA